MTLEQHKVLQFPSQQQDSLAVGKDTFIRDVFFTTGVFIGAAEGLIKKTIARTRRNFSQPENVIPISRGSQNHPTRR